METKSDGLVSVGFQRLSLVYETKTVKRLGRGLDKRPLDVVAQAQVGASLAVCYCVAV